MPTRRPAPSARPAAHGGPLAPPAGIPPAPLVALVAVLGYGLLAAGVAIGRPALAVAVVAVQLVLGLAWLGLLGADPVAYLVVGIGTVTGDVLLLRSEAATAGSLAGVLGLALVGAIVGQLARRHRQAVTAGYAAAVSAVVLSSAVALLLPLRQFTNGQAIALSALVAVAFAMAGCRLVPGPALLVRIAAGAVGTVAGTAYGAGAAELSAAPALVTAGVAAAAAVIVDHGFVRILGTRAPGSAPVSSAAYLPVAALLPVAAGLPAAYAVGWIVGG